MIGRNDPCWCESGKKWKKCHYPSLPQATEFDRLQKKYRDQYRIHLKTDKEIEGIRRSGHLAAKILDAVCARAKEGVSTQELNDYAEQLHKEAGAIPAPLNYGSPPFPRSICTSINDVICHGIPGNEILKDGDIMNIDVTCILDGYYGDCSRMVSIGTPPEASRRVVDVSYECLMRSVAAVKPGLLLHEIGDIITDHAESRGCSVVYQFVAHGVGLHFHENPQVLHSRNQNSTPLVEGMTFTIEPMINAGAPDAVIDSEDLWTARTPDGLPSAQWEYTLLVTSDGCEILTPWTDEHRSSTKK